MAPLGIYVGFVLEAYVMNTTHHTAKLALMMLGSTIGATLMFYSAACKLPPRGDSGDKTVQGDVRGIDVGGELAYKQVAFDREQHGCVSGPAADAEDCASCHHAKPQSAGKACAACHSRDEGRFSKKFRAFVPKLKEAMHDPDGGCRSCHDDTTEDGLWECRHCHTALNDL